MQELHFNGSKRLILKLKKRLKSTISRKAAAHKNTPILSNKILVSKIMVQYFDIFKPVDNLAGHRGK